MSSKASIHNLLAGERFVYTNRTGKPVELTFKTAAGTTVRAVVGIGHSMEFRTGQERATLYALEPEAKPERLQVVPSSR